MKIVRLVAMIASVIIFALAAIEISGQRVNLIGLGLFFLALAELLSIV